MAFPGMLSSSSRGNVIIIATIICLITVIFSFRSVFSEHRPWREPANDLPSFGETQDESKSDPTLVSRPPTSSDRDLASTSLSAGAVPTVESMPTSSPSAPASDPASLGSCDDFPDTSDIQVIMKTGATEAYDKLPIHFLTTLKCVNNTLFVSDLEMDMGSHHIYNVLEDFPEDLMKDNPDFELYRQITQYGELHEDPRPLYKARNGWNLDKYKFLHMMLKTWEHRSDAKWYLFVEADTAVMWDNMREFLDKFDSTRKLYIGSPTYLDIEFAHGGTGYIISHAAMEAAVGNHPDIAEKYDKDVRGVCCGDRFIAKVLLDENIKLTKAWPLLNGEKPLTFPYGEKHWCKPILTMHHMTAEEISQVWTFEMGRKVKGLKHMNFRDIYYHFVKPNMVARRDNWNNLSGDIRYDPEASFKTYGNDGKKFEQLSAVERASPESPENCAAMCEYDQACLQWMHFGRVCTLQHDWKMGGHQDAQGGKKWTSGWNLNRISAFEEKHGDCSDYVPKWETSGP